MRIGVVSDTHGYLDPRLPELFSGVDHILHAGDIGDALIVLELEAVAPVTAVLGNNDDGLAFRLTERVVLAEKTILLHHIVNPQQLDEPLSFLIKRTRPQLVVFGHTHKTFNETINGITFFNPGYAGKPRFSAVRSAAILELLPNQIQATYLPL